MFLAQTLTLLLPILVAGVIFIIVLKKNFLNFLNRPIDAGIKLKNQPLLGRNKTYRAPVIYITISIIICLILNIGLAYNLPWIHPIFAQPPLTLGFLYGFSYSLAELINSFIKRRLKIPPGASKNLFQYLVDTTDGIILASLTLSLIYGANYFQLLLIFLIGSTLHISTDLLMKLLKLKTK
jgi:hypothetical protein